MSKFVGAAILIFSFTAQAGDDCKHDDHTFRCVKYLKNHDGDTLNVELPGVHPLFGSNISVRVRGIDTPEISTKDKCEKDAGRAAKNLAESMLKNAKRIDLENLGRDKYFRILADVKIDGKSLSEVMLKQHLAYEYQGGTKKHPNWCDEKLRSPASSK